MNLSIENVNVTFKNHVKAIQDFNMNFDEGIYGLLGENGAGKTTLMRVITTILTPDSGEVTLNGMSYTKKNYQDIRKKIGYLPQELTLYPNMKLRESLEYLGLLSGVPKNICKKRIDFYLEKTNLIDHQNKKNKQLSGGMKRRAGLIQAILNEPEFLIVDEPTTGLDPEERVRIRNLLVDFSEGRTVLFSTHVVEDLATTTSKLAIMNKGKLLYNGSVKKLLEEAKSHVWICYALDEIEAKIIDSEYYVSSKVFDESGIKLRIISDTKPKYNCSPGEISLEDAYIYYNNTMS